MTTEPKTYHRSELEAVLAPDGITSDQIDRWIREGFLPPSTPVGRREYRAGVERLYSDQAVINAQWVNFMLNSGRSFHEIRVFLWIPRAIESDPEILKESLANVAFGWLNRFLQTPRLRGNPQSRLTTVFLRNTSDSFGAAITSELGSSEKFKEFIRVLAGLAVGVDPGFSILDDPDKGPQGVFNNVLTAIVEVLMSALGKEANRQTRRTIRNELEMMRPTLLGMMMAKEFSLPKAEQYLNRASDRDLERSRKNVHFFMKVLTAKETNFQLLIRKEVLLSSACLVCFLLCPSLAIVGDRFRKKYEPDLAKLKYTR